MSSLLKKSQQQLQRQLSKASTNADDWDMTDDNTQTSTTNPSPQSPASFTRQSFGMASLMHISKEVSNVTSLKLEQFAELFDQMTNEFYTQLALIQDGDENAMETTELGKHRTAHWLLEELKNFCLAVADRLKDNKGSQNSQSSSKSQQSRSRYDKKLDTNFGNINGSDISAKELEKIQEELRTYILLEKVMAIRRPEPTRVNLDSSIQLYLEVKGSVHEFTPEAELWERFLLSDSESREKKAILSWLEEGAEEATAKLYDMAAELEANAGIGQGTWTRGFLHTREKIKSEKRQMEMTGLTFQKKTSQGLTQLDPDAPARHGASLEKLDENYDKSLWLNCFIMLRRGKSWKEIRDWCQTRREGWRAITFGMAVNSQESRTGLAGPQAGQLWRQMCLAAARHTEFDTYQRAIYGLLAGDVESVDPACRSFEDLLFVRYTAMLIRSFEVYLQTSHANRFSQPIGQKFPTLNRITTEEESSTDQSDYALHLLSKPICAKDASNAFKFIQASIIGDDINNMFQSVGTIFAYRASQGGRTAYLFQSMEDYNFDARYECVADDYDGIRFLVHIYAILRWLGYNFSPDVINLYSQNIVIAYIDYLRVQRKLEAIPSYSSMLKDREVKHTTLGIMMADITDPQEQKSLVNIVSKQDVNIALIITHQYRYAAELMGWFYTGQGYEGIDMVDLLEATTDIRWPGSRIKKSVATDVRKALDEKQERLIRSVEWFQYEDSEAQWRELFMGLSYALRLFLSAGMLNAAVELTKRVPHRAMSTIKSKRYLGQAVDVFDEDTEIEEPIRYAQTPLPHIDGLPREPLEGEEREFMLDILRTSSLQYKEMQQLALIIEGFALWRNLEDDILEREQDGSSGKKEASASLKPALEELAGLMDMLMKGFMTKFDQEIEVEYYIGVRRAYVPTIIIAYNSCRTFAANYLGPDTILGSYDLTTHLASDDNTELLGDLDDTGLTAPFVKAMASTSAVLIRLNQDSEMVNLEEGKKPRRRDGRRGAKSRDWIGESIDLWDPTKKMPIPL